MAKVHRPRDLRRALLPLDHQVRYVGVVEVSRGDRLDRRIEISNLVDHDTVDALTSLVRIVRVQGRSDLLS